MAPVSPRMRPNLTLVTLGVSDLARAVKFYHEGLGLKVQNNWKEQGVAFLPLQGIVLALWPRVSLAQDAQLPAEGSGFRGIALAHNARDRAEVDAVLREAERAGAQVLKPANEAFWGGYSGYFADLDDHVWEVAHNPFWTLDERGIVRLE